MTADFLQTVLVGGAVALMGWNIHQTFRLAVLVRGLEVEIKSIKERVKAK